MAGVKVLKNGTSKFMSCAFCRVGKAQCSLRELPEPPSPSSSRYYFICVDFSLPFVPARKKGPSTEALPAPSGKYCFIYVDLLLTFVPARKRGPSAEASAAPSKRVRKTATTHGKEADGLRERLQDHIAQARAFWREAEALMAAYTALE